jgi:hypothetical protein
MKSNDQRIYHVVFLPSWNPFTSFCGANAKRSAMRAAGKTGSVRRVTGADLDRLMRR